MVVSKLQNHINMSSYILRYPKDMQKFLSTLKELIEIYETETPLFFKQCVQNIDVDIYDKILQLNGSKTKSKYWSDNYISCISMSKQIISAVTYVEREEYKTYQYKLVHYEQHYGQSVIPNFTVSMTLPSEFSE